MKKKIKVLFGVLFFFMFTYCILSVSLLSHAIYQLLICFDYFPVIWNLDEKMNHLLSHFQYFREYHQKNQSYFIQKTSKTTKCHFLTLTVFISFISSFPCCRSDPIYCTKMVNSIFFFSSGSNSQSIIGIWISHLKFFLSKQVHVDIHQASHQLSFLYKCHFFVWLQLYLVCWLILSSVQLSE